MSQIITALRAAQFPLLLAYASYMMLTPSPGALFTSVWDKALHLGCWLVLTLSMQVALKGIRAPVPLAGSLVGAGALLVYSMLLEWAQTLVPERFSARGTFSATPPASRSAWSASPPGTGCGHNRNDGRYCSASLLRISRYRKRTLSR